MQRIALPFTSEAGPIALLVHGVLESLAGGHNSGRDRWARHTQLQAHVSLVARCCGNLNHCATETHEASDIRTTLNIYGDVVTNEMEQADSKLAALALNSDSKVIPAVVSH